MPARHGPDFHGPHFCQCARVARMMAGRILLSALFDRFVGMKLVDPDKVVWYGFAFRGSLGLPVRLE